LNPRESKSFLTKDDFPNHPIAIYIKKNFSRVIIINPGGNGGDSELARNFADLFEESLFIDINTLPTLTSQNNKKSLVVFFNLDKLNEASSIVHHLSQYNFVISIYTLHHPVEGIIAMNISQFLGGSVLSNIILSLGLSKILPLLKSSFYLLRSLISLKTGELPAIPINYNKVLSHCNHIFVCSSKEKRAISNIISDKDISIFPHLISDPLESSASLNSAGSKHTKPYVIIAGRSEFRKNLHSTIRLMKNFPCIQFAVFTTFDQAKSINSYQERLIKSFRSLPNCKLTLNSSAPALYNAIRASAILINPSWYEVNSMLDLFAIRNLVPLITTKYSWLDSDRENIYFFDPFNPNSLLKTFLKLRDAVE